MMLCLRLVIAWLVMAAVPLQGLAATTMAFCGGAHHAQLQSVEVEPVAPSVNVNGARHHHSKHSHAAKAEVKKTGGGLQASTKPLPDVNHKCGVCAACCHGIAITELPHWRAFASLPQAELTEPFAPIHARPSQVPDKPPRA